MRTYGRVTDEFGNKTWKVVETDTNGFDDEVWLTTLAQVCKLNLGESPFWSDWGIPAHPAVVQQVFPDYYMALIQQRFAPHFASLILSKVPSPPNQPKPTYFIAVTTNQGVKISGAIPT